MLSLVPIGIRATHRTMATSSLPQPIAEGVYATPWAQRIARVNGVDLAAYSEPGQVWRVNDVITLVLDLEDQGLAGPWAEYKRTQRREL